MNESKPRRGRRGKPPAEGPVRGLLPGEKPTLRTIAEMTGLAVTTISRALNNAPELAQDTRERVQKIAAEIGYLPDRAALRLKTGRTNVISLILDPHDEILGFGQSMVSGLTAALRGTTYHLVITPNFRNVAPLDPIRHIIRNRMADGIIFSRTEPDDARVRLLQENNFAFVSHGRTEIATPHAYVDYDNVAFCLSGGETAGFQRTQKDHHCAATAGLHLRETSARGFHAGHRRDGGGLRDFSGHDARQQRRRNP